MTYSYEAKDGAGRTVTGSLEAPSEVDAARRVRDMGYFPMRLAAAGSVAVQGRDGKADPSSYGSGFEAATPRQALTPGRWLLVHLIYPIWSGVGLRDMALFYRQFSTLINAGVPIYQCLTTLVQQSSNAKLRDYLRQITARVQAGGSLSEGMAQFPWIFTDFHRAMIGAGEVGGRLDIMLMRLSAALEQEYVLRNNIKRELWYPIVVVHCAFFLPPLVLLIVKNDPAGYFRAAVLPLLEAYGVLITVYVLTRLASQFKTVYDGIIAMLPAIGGAVRMIALARICRALSSLYSAGIALPRAIYYAAAAGGNAYMAGRINKIIPRVESGESIVNALAGTNVFPPMVISMLGTGEVTGSLDQTMDKVAEYYEQESVVRLHQLSVTLGAIAMILVGIRVAMIVIKFYTGMYSGVMNDNG